MPAAAAPQAAAPARRQYRPKAGSLMSEIMEFCDVPRETHEVIDWLGYPERVRSAIKDLVLGGRMVNLRPGAHSGLYVRADRAPVCVERICWYPASEPLADETRVLVSEISPGGADTREAYRSMGQWLCAVTHAPLRGRVTAWARKPAGPTQTPAANPSL